MSDDLKPQMMLVGPTAYQAYWREYARLGPRHANVKRWLVDLGWTASPGVLDAYLVPERPKESLYG